MSTDGENVVLLQLGSHSLKAAKANSYAEEILRIPNDNFGNPLFLSGQLKQIWQKFGLAERPSNIVLLSGLNQSKIPQFLETLFEALPSLQSIYVADEGLMALYGCGVVHGIVVNIGHSSTDVTVVYESIVISQVSESLDLGAMDVQFLLHQKLQQDVIFLETFSKHSNEIPADLVNFILEQGHCRCHHSINAEDVPFSTKFEYNNHEIHVGQSRFDCLEVFFSPELVGKETLSIPEAIISILDKIDPDKRALLSDNVLFTGPITKVPGLVERISREIKFNLANSEYANDFQPKSIRTLSIPEYFTTLKGRLEIAPLIGASIASKIVFSDSRNFISRAELQEHGRFILNMK